MIRTTFYLTLRFPLTTLTVLLLFALASAGCGDAKEPGKGPDSTAKKNGAAPAGDSAGAVAGFVEGEPVDPEVAYSLGLAPKIGDIYRYRLTMKGATETQGQKLTEETVYNFTQRVTGVNSDGSFTLEMRYDSIRSRRSFPAGVIDSVARTISYDTRGKIDTTIGSARQAKALVGQKVNLTLSKGGEVREVSNLEPVLSAMLGSLRDSIDPRAIEEFRTGLKVSAFQSVIQQVFLQGLPDSSVHVGSSWTRRDSMPLVLPIGAIPSRATITYKVDEIKKVEDTPVGQVGIVLSTAFPQKKIDTKELTTMVDEARANGTGSVLINLASGFPMRKSTKIDVHMKLTAKAKIGPNAGKSVTASQGQSTTTLVELLEFKPGSGE